MAINFETGKTYNTVKKLGVVKKGDGRLQISQRIGKDAPDIEPSENLTFESRDGGKLWFVRTDGTKVCGHRSHFDPEDAYNSQKENRADLSESIKRKKSEVDAAASKLDQLLKQEAEAQAEAAPAVSDSDRDEATEIFESLDEEPELTDDAGVQS